MIDLEWYQSFIAVYRTGNVSRAAEARFLTQPAVSQHLAALETAIGEALFQRLPRKMVPTERGKALYSRVVQAIDLLEQTSQTLRATTAEQPLLRIGVPPEYFAEVALDLVLPLSLRFAIQFGTPQMLIPALERGELDLVIATQRLPSMAVDYRKITDEEFVLVGSRHYPALPDYGAEGAETLIQQWLEVQPWISHGTELPTIRRFWQNSFNTRPNFQPILILPDLRMIRHAVEQNYGLSILPEYLCRDALQEERLRIIWQPLQPVTNELWFASRRVDRNRAELQQVYTALVSS